MDSPDITRTSLRFDVRAVSDRAQAENRRYTQTR